jgi:CheY-like chemotaxis protein
MSKRILLVDDHEIERTALRTILQEEPNWTITEAGDGATALDLLCSQVIPQLCLVDLRMPQVDGLEFLRRVRRDPDFRDLKVIITSASRDRGTIVELAKLGIEGYLLKPFDPQRTLSIVRPVMALLPDPDAASLPERDLLTKVALVVDDDPVAREALAAFIKEETHWTVMEANDGAAALDVFGSGVIPDYVFLDLHMPGLDGLGVLSAIRANPKWENMRIAVTSGERDRDKVRALAKLRIEAYLLKPIDPVKVRAALRAVA